MDSLTARLLSRSGLNRRDPMVPPTQNMRMVVLKEKYGKAEILLHNARVALQTLRDAQESKIPSRVTAATSRLYAAMGKLEGQEADFFASRYFGSGNKKILKDWNQGHKMVEFQKKLSSLEADIGYRATTARGVLNGSGAPALSRNAQEAQACAERAFDALKAIDRLHPIRSRVAKNTPTVGNHPAIIETNIKGIRTELAKALGGENGSSNEDVNFIRESLKDAETYERLGHVIMKNRWDVPYDLRIKETRPTY